MSADSALIYLAFIFVPAFFIARWLITPSSMLTVLVAVLAASSANGQTIRVTNGAQLDAAVNLTRNWQGPVYIVVDQDCPAPPRPTPSVAPSPQPLSPEARQAISGVMEGSNSVNTGYVEPLTIQNPFFRRKVLTLEKLKQLGATTLWH